MTPSPFANECTEMDDPNSKQKQISECSSDAESDQVSTSSPTFETSSEITLFGRDLLPCLSNKVKHQLRLRVRQVFSLVLLSSAYAATYLLRKPFGVIKSELKEEFGLELNLLGWLEFTMFLPYSFISLGFWKIGIRLGSRLTLGFGLLSAAAFTALIGTVQSMWFMFVLFFVTGAAQALCWPASCTLLAAWFSTQIRNTVVGIFGSTYFFGGVSGSFLVIYLNQTYQWRGVFLWPALLVAFRGVLVLMMARKPAYHGIIVPGQEEDPDHHTIDEKQHDKLLKDIWDIPLVPEISLSLLFIKTVRYAVMMWFPLYLQETQGFSLKEAGLITVSFEVGGIVGSIGLGILLDTLLKGNSLLVCSIIVGISGIILSVLSIVIDFGAMVQIICLSLAGAFICGSGLVLGGAAINKIINSNGSKYSVLSVINGVGSLGMLMEGPLMSYTILFLGYSYIIPILSAFSIVGSICIYRAHSVYTKNNRYNRVVDV